MNTNRKCTHFWKARPRNGRWDAALRVRVFKIEKAQIMVDEEAQSRRFKWTPVKNNSRNRKSFPCCWELSDVVGKDVVFLHPWPHRRLACLPKALPICLGIKIILFPHVPYSFLTYSTNAFRKPAEHSNSSGPTLCCWFNFPWLKTAWAKAASCQGEHLSAWEHQHSRISS